MDRTCESLIMMGEVDWLVLLKWVVEWRAAEPIWKPPICLAGRCTAKSVEYPFQEVERTSSDTSDRA